MSNRLPTRHMPDRVVTSVADRQPFPFDVAPPARRQVTALFAKARSAVEWAVRGIAL
jgi:hypothetical protein